ncbi:MAG: threonine transporter RhtB [Piscirickettsiaceae bacterium]|nr:MAG: threonine transporter RhtB [Piscirickettsiaceae bacterium]
MDSLTIFIVASLLLAISPGPDNLFVLTQSALYGKKAGILITLGLCTGLAIHITMVALGVAVVFQATWALTALKVFGASYLTYLAYITLTDEPSTVKHSPPLTGSAYYKRGIIMCSTNPKVSLFFIAFLPQFIPTNTNSYISDVVILGSIFATIALLVFSGIAYAGGKLQKRLERSPRIQLSLNKIAAGVFFLLAINLLMS